jgi:hypothetical protein
MRLSECSLSSTSLSYLTSRKRFVAIDATDCVAFTASAGMDVNCILLEHVAAPIARKENHDFSM